MAKLLLVDDEQDICEITSFLFESNGHETIVAFDADDGFEKVKTFMPDIVISDIRMLVVVGYHYLKEYLLWMVKKPIVFLITGYADISKEEAISKGAVRSIFSKPIRLQEIYDQLFLT